MKLVWRDIINGWRNSFFPPADLKALISSTQEERRDICRGCPFNSTPNKINSFSKCNDCGCPLKQKTSCLHCQCPQERWLAVTEKEQADAINEYIKTKEK